jgi:predicted AlkP superfamily pyrophosphatase or phosphodiesterase
MTWDMNQLCSTHDVLLLVLDTLRFDVAKREWDAVRTPNLLRLLPNGWEERHSPGSFTYAAHHAFFAGFLPTPTCQKTMHTRLFAARFAGSETTGPKTKIFDAPDIVKGLHGEGWRTICIGGVGFFNRQTPLSRVLPELFEESHWQPRFGVTDRDSAAHQFEFAADLLKQSSRPTFLFINVSALHQPNYFYLKDAGPDTIESHAAALRYVDSQLPILIRALNRKQRPTFCILTSDHGTTYGEDGWTGHRVAHPHVWTVPYGEAIVPENGGCA